MSYTAITTRIVLFARSCALVLALVSGVVARPAHYAGGSITWTCLGGNNYQINLDLFLDCTGFTIIPQDLTFTSDCGTSFTIAAIPPPPPVEVSQLCSAQLPNSTCNGGALAGIEWYRFSTVQSLPPCDSWTVSWDICCRSTAIDLIGNQGMYIEAEINTLDAACDNSPVFTDQSLPYVCVNQPVYYNFGVTEPDGDLLVYSLINAQYFSGSPLPVNYQPGFSGGTPVPGITLDPITGQIVFTPTLSGNYVVVLQVEEYDVNGNLIGTVMRDIVFVVMPCMGAAPTTQGVVNNTAGILTGANSIEVCNGQAFCVDIVFNDADAGTVLQVVSQASTLLPGSTFTISGANPATATLCWTGDVNNSPVNVLVQADDGSCPIENTASIAVNITSTGSGGPPPSAGTNGSVQVCPGGVTFFLIDELGGTPDPSGSWTDPNGNVHTSEFDPSADPAGVYTYTVGNGCASATATVTVSYSAIPSAGTNGNLSICSNSAPVGLFALLGGSPTAGGAWTTPGGAPFSGLYDPLVNAPGAYTYTVTGGGGCVNSSATVTVTGSMAPDAGTSASTSICSSSGAVGLIGFLGGSPQSGGTWTAPGGGAMSGSYDPAVQAPGIYTYTVTGAPPCGSATATVTVTENPVPDAGGNAVISMCSSSAPVDLFNALSGAPNSGGVWTDPGGAPHGVSYDPAVDGPGVYVYVVTGTAPCPNAAATVTVNESPAPIAGTDGSLSLCSSSSITLLINSLGMAQAGGAWTGPGGSPFTGSYDPITDGPGVYTYTVAGTAPCAADQATVTVTEAQQPNAGSDGSLAICGNNAPTNLQTLLIGTQGGGTWTDPLGAPFSGIYDASVNASGLYTYSIAAIAPCITDVATVTVVENTPVQAGSDAFLSVCSDGVAADLYSLLAGAQSGGSWSAPGGAPFSGTYDPALHASGVFSYTLVGIAPCPNDVALVTVTENLAPDAGTGTVLSTCSNSAGTDLFGLLSVAQAGGTWTTPGGGPFAGIYDPAIDGPGVYTYAITGIAPCGSDLSTVIVTENLAPDAGVDGAIALCSDGAPVDLFAQLAGAQAGGTWTGPGGAGCASSYDPALSAPGVFTYTLSAAAPCMNDVATVTVTESTAPQAGSDGLLMLCSNNSAADLFAQLAGAQAGGTWTAPGGGAFSGTFDPAVDLPGDHTYTVSGIAPCASDVATVTVTVNAAPDPGTDGSLTVCSTGAQQSMMASLGGFPQSGGTWSGPSPVTLNTYDAATMVPGVYTYTVNGLAPCASAQATVTVNENAAPDAGTDGSIVVCDVGAASDLFAQLAGAQPGGTWTAPGGGAFSGSYDPAVNASGTYTYTVSGTAPCASDASTVSVTETSSPNAGTDGTITLCSNGGNDDLFAHLTGAQAGGTWTAPGGAPHPTMFDPVVDAAGTYVYTINAMAPCVSDQSQVTVSITAAPNAGGDAAITVCDQGAATNLMTLLVGAGAGGTWTAPGGAAFSGSYDPVVNASGAYTYTVSGIAPCASDASTVSVTETSSPNAGTDGIVTLCSNGGNDDLFTHLIGAQAGGTWTAPGGAPHAASFDPAVDPAGIYLYTLSATAPCVSDQAQVSVSITAAPDAGSDAAVTLCDQGTATDLFALLAGAGAGGTWTAPGGGAFSGSYAPAVDASGAYTYTVSGSAPCGSDAATVNVTETSSPNAGTDGATTLCANGTSDDLFAHLTGAQAGGSWTAPGGAPHSALLDPTTDPPGTYLYTLNATAPCLGDQAEVMVTIDPAPDPGTSGVADACAGDAPFDLFASLGGAPQPGGQWLDPGNQPFSGTFDPTGSLAGPYTYTVGGGVCATASASVLVMVSPGPNAGQGGPLTVCDQGLAIDLFGALSGAPGTNGTWTGPDGAPFSGMLDPAIALPGDYTYLVTSGTACPDASAVVQVAIASGASAGTAGNLTLCANGPLTSLFNSLGGAPDSGGAWTGPNGQPVTGIFDPASGLPGSYTYTVAGVAPCASVSSSLNVEVNPVPDAGEGSAAAFCSTDAPAQLIDLLGGDPDAGGTWTSPNGNPFNGLFVPGISTTGTYTYSVTGLAPCAAEIALVQLSVSAAASVGADGAIEVCSDADPFQLFPLLGEGTGLGGAWTTPGGGACNGLVQPANDMSGAYAYTITPQLPCPQVQATVLVGIHPLPQPEISMSMTDGCAPVEVTFSNGAQDIGVHEWDLGNGQTSGLTTPEPVIYGASGNYAITLTVTAAEGCAATVSLAGGLTIHDRPEAAFSMLSPNLNTNAPLAWFHNESTGASTYEWAFDDLGTSTETDPQFLFPSDVEGSYLVCLTAYAAPSCFDTACAEVRVPYGAGLYVPNAFTPDGNGANDVFTPVISGILPDSYTFLVYDRWGHQLFSSDRIGSGWDGTAGDGTPAPVGVYVWKVFGHDGYSTDGVKRMGHVTLVR